MKPNGWHRLAMVLGAVVLVLGGLWLLRPGPEVANPHPWGESIVCFGDSLTAGTGAPSGMSYPEQLERLLGEPVINAGRPGDTTASALARLDDDVLALRPRLVLITLGGNDLMQGTPADEAMTRLETIVRRIHRQGALAVVGGLDPPLLDKGYGSAYDELARQTRCVLIDDILQDVLGRQDLMSDQIHPNADGYAIVARRFEQAIRPYLERGH
jgi:lysophospholipase L1-like esterase